MIKKESDMSGPFLRLVQSDHEDELFLRANNVKRRASVDPRPSCSQQGRQWAHDSACALHTRCTARALGLGVCFHARLDFLSGDHAIKVRSSTLGHQPAWPHGLGNLCISQQLPRQLLQITSQPLSLSSARASAIPSELDDVAHRLM